MNENQQNDRKHETIDILVDPRHNAPAPQNTPPAQKRAPQSGTASPVHRSAPDPQGDAPSVQRPASAARHPAPAAQHSAQTSPRIGPETPAAATRKVSAVSPSSEPVAPAMAVPIATPAAVPEKPKKSPREKGGILLEQGRIRSTLTRTLLYIAFVVVISAILSTIAIRWANDVFALVKDEVTTTISLPEDATISEVAGILKDSGIIQYPFVFRMYVGYRHRNDDPPLSFKAGEYELKSTLNYDQITNLIKFKSTRQIIKLTIPEGLNVNETIQLFLDNGIGTREGFVQAINEYPYEYAFMERLNQIQFAEGRSYRLEGYLFPDTYEFYTDSSEVAIVDKMLSAFEAHFEKAYYDRLDEIGMNLDQVVTIASMAQMEGRTENDFYAIAGVFNNRLKSATLRYLQSDATVQYAIQDHKEDLTAEDLSVASPYNTYVTQGLPPGPIANPGWAAIQAALYPEANDYYYFVSDIDGTTLFAKDLAEHQRNVAQVRANREKAAASQ